MSKTRRPALICPLPGGYSLRRSTVDGAWWIYLGRVNMALKIVPSLPCDSGGSIDRDVQEFAAAMMGITGVRQATEVEEGRLAP